jgi:putative alpha-1,2-mannosidase
MVFVWLTLASSVLAQPVSQQPVDYVNPLIGTAPFEDAEYLGNNPPKGEELYYGSVVPGAMAPDGTVKLGPDTGFDGIFHVRGSSYRYTDSSIMGFSHTHHEYNRYANILFMPTVGPVKTEPGSGLRITAVSDTYPRRNQQTKGCSMTVCRAAGPTL